MIPGAVQSALEASKKVAAEIGKQGENFGSARGGGIEGGDKIPGIKLPEDKTGDWIKENPQRKEIELREPEGVKETDEEKIAQEGRLGDWINDKSEDFGHTEIDIAPNDKKPELKGDVVYAENNKVKEPNYNKNDVSASQDAETKGSTEASEVKTMPTKNQALEGQKHPETGVPFVRKEVENSEGEKVEVVVPEFESTFDAQLPDDLLEATDKEQFDECNRQLKEAIENDPELMTKFTDEQLEQIVNGETPDGYTWHHDAEKGKMQLVDTKTHAQTGHTGGKVIWGGGKENR